MDYLKNKVSLVKYFIYNCGESRYLENLDFVKIWIIVVRKGNKRFIVGF